MTWNIIALSLLSIFLCGCGVSYKEKYNAEGSLIERSVSWTQPLGSVERENIYCIIGDKENPSAVLFIGKSVIDKDEFYIAMQPMLLNMLKTMMTE